MQRSESSDSRGSAMAPLHAQPQTEGTFRCSARFEGGVASRINPKGHRSQTPRASRVCLRSAVGCKPREAVLYPDSVAGADPRVGPY